MLVRFRGEAKPRPLLAPRTGDLTRALSPQATWQNEVRFFIKASRPGFWLTAIWFYLLPLAPHLPLNSFEFWLGLFYVGFPLGMIIYAGNDLTDELTDSLNPRKDTFLFGARPTHDQIVELPWRIFLVQVPFIALFTAIMGPRALLWFLAGLVLSSIYNARGGAKDRPFLDLLAQVGYLLVFVLACWLNGRPLSPWYIWVFGALFAMHSHLFGQIMDVAPDAAAGRQTTAVTIGILRSKLLISALLATEMVVALQIAGKPWLAPFVGLAALWFLLDALVLWRERPYASWQMTAFFLGWNALIVIEIVGSRLYSLLK